VTATIKPACDDCKTELTDIQATPARLRRGERLCTKCWVKRLKNKTLPSYFDAKDEERRVVETLLDNMLRKSLP
jgi:hypothetical protein